MSAHEAHLRTLRVVGIGYACWLVVTLIVALTAGALEPLIGSLAAGLLVFGILLAGLRDMR